MESKIPSISGLATTSELTWKKNNCLVKKKKKKKKKTDYNTKISDIEKKLTDHNQSSTS